MADTTTLIEALVKVQAELKNPPLDGFNPHFRSKFSTLLAVRDTIVPVFNKHGIAVFQVFNIHDNGTPALQTILAKGTERIISTAVIPAPANIQAWAASATYIRRVSLLAIAGVVGDPDADAEDVVRQVSPHPDTSAVEPSTAERYASEFRACLASGNETGTYQTHLDLHDEGEIVYSATWKLLNAPDRAKIKSIIAAHKPAANF